MTLAQRLLKGATVLARFWREGKRCQSGWAPSCDCDPSSKTDFCGAKMRWTELAIQDARVVEDSEWGILFAMKSNEIDSAALTFTIEHPEHGAVRVGKNGEVRRQDLAKLVDSPEAVDGFLKILKVFPKAAVVRTEGAS